MNTKLVTGNIQGSETRLRLILITHLKILSPPPQSPGVGRQESHVGDQDETQHHRHHNNDYPSPPCIACINATPRHFVCIMSC
jgi:hypothetical protein